MKLGGNLSLGHDALLLSISGPGSDVRTRGTRLIWSSFWGNPPPQKKKKKKERKKTHTHKTLRGSQKIGIPDISTIARVSIFVSLILVP